MSQDSRWMELETISGRTWKDWKDWSHRPSQQTRKGMEILEMIAENCGRKLNIWDKVYSSYRWESTDWIWTWVLRTNDRTWKWEWPYLSISSSIIWHRSIISFPRQALSANLIVTGPRPVVEDVGVQIRQKDCLINLQSTVLCREGLSPQICRKVMSHRSET